MTVSPRTGPTTGGTVVTIVGEGLMAHPGNYTPQCMFGDQIVNAAESKEGVIKCLAPPVDVPKAVDLEVSYNMQDFTSHGLQYIYEWPLHVAKLQPAWGPVSGETNVNKAQFRDGAADEVSFW